MPFTPLHMGPGMLVKALLQGSFSLMVFGWAQILMDIQPLFVILSGEGHLHGFSHTYVGATLIACFAIITGKYLSEFGLILLGVASRQKPIKISWPVVTLSAFIGTFSHVLIDSVMHSDMEPLYPISKHNGLLGLLSMDYLHYACLACGAVGVVIYYGVRFVKEKT